MLSRTYLIIEQNYKYGKLYNKVISKFKIKCIGGDNLNDEKELMPKMIFVKTSEIPAKAVKRGINWKQLLQNIPKGESWIVTEDDENFKISTVKNAVKEINKAQVATGGNALFNAIQRTEEGKVKLYVNKA